MTPAAKITYLAGLFIGLSVGLWFGYRNRINLLQSYAEARLITAPSSLGDFSREQYAHADFEHARVALQSYASLLEEMEKAKPDKTHKIELSMTYARLALLEDEGRNSEQSHEFMTKARYWHTANGGRRDLSDSEIKASLVRFDNLQGLGRSQIGTR